MGRPAVMGLNTKPTPPQSVGDYDLLEKIAEGGMGAIYRGRQRHNGQIVAIKIEPYLVISCLVFYSNVYFLWSGTRQIRIEDRVLHLHIKFISNHFVYLRICLMLYNRFRCSVTLAVRSALLFRRWGWCQRAGLVSQVQVLRCLNPLQSPGALRRKIHRNNSR